jgi:xanthine dehydrogenase accessory factor
MLEAPETFALIERVKHSGGRAAMATLVRTIGTTPRKEGTKMFVGEGGSIFGSVTIGGCVDARVIAQSEEVLGASSPRLLNLKLGDEEAWEIGLTCGGAVDVLVEPVSDDLVEMYEAARKEWQAGRSVAIATVIAGEGTGSRVMVDDSGAVRGAAPAAVLEALRDLPATARTLKIGSSEVYVEILRRPATVLIFGAGAVAIPLVTFAKTLGFETIVIDGRPRFATPERFPDADEIRVGIVSEIAHAMTFGPNTPAVLVAHDYKIDVPVLKKALAGDTPYIGLLGSRRRGAALLQMLRDEGIEERQLARIRVPVGLDLGGESAAEIALSIIAEIVAVMHGRRGAPLSARP